jgi:hypothetical protein
METISADDLQILQEAIGQLNQAQSNKSFVEGFISRKYKLQNGDSIDVTNGTVSRRGTVESSGVPQTEAVSNIADVQ